MKIYNTPTTLAIRLENSCSLCQVASPGDGSFGINRQGTQIITSD